MHAFTRAHAIVACQTACTLNYRHIITFIFPFLTPPFQNGFFELDPSSDAHGNVFVSELSGLRCRLIILAREMSNDQQGSILVGPWDKVYKGRHDGRCPIHKGCSSPSDTLP